MNDETLDVDETNDISSSAIYLIFGEKMILCVTSVLSGLSSPLVIASCGISRKIVFSD